MVDASTCGCHCCRATLFWNWLVRFGGGHILGIVLGTKCQITMRTHGDGRPFTHTLEENVSNEMHSRAWIWPCSESQLFYYVCDEIVRGHFMIGSIGFVNVFIAIKWINNRSCSVEWHLCLTGDHIWFRSDAIINGSHKNRLTVTSTFGTFTTFIN